MRLAHDRRGAGAPLVLVHPLGADRRVWDPVLGALSAERDVIAVDLPGFGESPPLEDETPTPAALAGAAAALLADLEIERPDVAGNSLGGWVALELALRRAVRSVAAIAPAGLWSAPLRPKPGVGRIAARAALPLLPAVTRTEGGRRALLGSVVAHPERVPPAAALQLVRAYALAPGLRAANDAMRAGRFERLADVEAPVTLLWPQFDRLVARPRRLPAAVRNVTLPGCGHLPFWDDPDLVATALLEATSPQRAAA